MAAPLVSDDLGTLIAPLIPPERPKPKGGRPPISHRAALTGILFVLKSGIPWEMLPAEMGCGSGMTCWRRLRDWQQAGVWQRLHHVLLDRLGRAGQRERAGEKGGEETGPNPTDRGRPGSKRHVLTDAGGIPLALTLNPANVHDSQCLERVIDADPPVQRPTAPKASQTPCGQGL